MPNKMVNIIINDKKLSVPEGYTVLKAATENGIYIPRLCFLEGIHEEANCRICLVEIDGVRGLKTSCKTIVSEGMIIKVDTENVHSAVKKNLELLAANHRFDCWKCPRERNCEFLKLLQNYDVDNIYGENETFSKKVVYLEDQNDAIVIDSSKCVLCGRCVSTCEKVAGTGVLNYNERGSKCYVGTALFHPLSDSGCIYCGKCIQACPTAALREKDDVSQVEKVLRDKNKTVIVEIAPAVRSALGEEFGYPIGTNVEGKIYSALEKLGVKEVMDTNFTADLTIMEEGTELISRIKNNGVLPLFTSCSPGWIRYIEQYNPEYIPNLSTCKSPQQMGGAIAKHYYAEKLGLKKEDVIVVSIMPCVAKKSEANLKEMVIDNVKDVDYVLTTREFARLIKRHGIDFNDLEDKKPFGMLETYTGAGVIFGVTGGVMEAALRTVSEILEEKETQIEFKEVRGLKNIKEATYKIAGLDINVAVVHGGAAIKEFMNILKTSDKKYHFVEFMGCTGGCINGGGQPIVNPQILEKIDVREKRASVLYDIDKNSKLRKSHLNDQVMKLYQEFLGEPNSHLSHKLLHTHYEAKSFYNNK